MDFLTNKAHENCLYGNGLPNFLSLGPYSVIPLAEYLCWLDIAVVFASSWKVTELKPETLEIDLLSIFCK